MRIVADTNTVISGLLWHGAPRQVLDAAREGRVTLFTSAILLAELQDVLQRSKFADRLERARVKYRDLVNGFAALATLVKPAEMSPTILADIEDDAVLACALAAQAEVIVSGDNDLIRFNKFRDIPILKATELLNKLPPKPKQE